MKRLASILLLAVFCLSTASAQSLKVSILGDSYSTYRGMIPEGYAVFYPLNGNDVQKVEQTWWDIFIKEHGYQLEKNNSYSGSTVCNTGYNKEDYSDRAFISRINYIGNPDILFIFGGTNDSWAGSPIGDYRYAGWTKNDLFSFRPALAYLLDGLKGLYPATRIYLILNSELKEEINESVKTIGKHYDVPVIVLHDIEKQIGHPSIKGMRAIADQLTEFLANEEKK